MHRVFGSPKSSRDFRALALGRRAVCLAAVSRELQACLYRFSGFVLRFRIAAGRSRATVWHLIRGAGPTAAAKACAATMHSRGRRFDAAWLLRRAAWGGSRSRCCCPLPSSSARSRASASGTALLYEVCHLPAEALERIAVPEDASLILVFSDINMPGRIGLELLPKIQAAHPEVPSPSTAASELNGSPALPVRPVVHRLCWCSRDDSGPTRRSGPRLSRPAIVAWRSRRGGEIAVPIS